MPKDLKAKLSPLAETKTQPTTVVVLWPAAEDQQLPTETAAVWDSSAKKSRAVLHHLGDDDLNKLLALPDWVKDIRGKTEQPVPENAVRDFLKHKFTTLLSLVMPAQQGKASHAN